MAKIGRDGRVPKNFVGADIPVNPGMRFVRSLDGTHFVGISRTQAEHPADGNSPAIHEPTVEKNFYRDGQVYTHPSMARRRPGTAMPGNASAILSEAALVVAPKK